MTRQISAASPEPRLQAFVGQSRVLDARECRAAAMEIAGDRGQWHPHIHFDPQDRFFQLLHLDSFVEAWLLCWAGSNDTGWHDHGVSSAGVVVALGSVMEDVLTFGGPTTRRLRCQDALDMPPGHIHRMYAADEPGASIHVYSPPLGRVGQYHADTSGRAYRVEQVGSTPLASNTSLI